MSKWHKTMLEKYGSKAGIRKEMIRRQKLRNEANYPKAKRAFNNREFARYASMVGHTNQGHVMDNVTLEYEHKRTRKPGVKFGGAGNRGDK